MRPRRREWGCVGSAAGGCWLRLPSTEVVGSASEVAMRVVFVHGACVRNGSWWWHRTAALLAERGVSSVTPALPSCGETGVPGGSAGPGLPEDVAEVRRL